jgi:hypothetical protein
MAAASVPPLPSDAIQDRRQSRPPPPDPGQGLPVAVPRPAPEEPAQEPGQGSGDGQVIQLIHDILRNTDGMLRGFVIVAWNLAGVFAAAAIAIAVAAALVLIVVDHVPEPAKIGFTSATVIVTAIGSVFGRRSTRKQRKRERGQREDRRDKPRLLLTKKPTTGRAIHAAPNARPAVIPAQTTSLVLPDNSEDAHKPAPVAITPAPAPYTASGVAALYDSAAGRLPERLTASDETAVCLLALTTHPNLSMRALARRRTRRRENTTAPASPGPPTRAGQPTRGHARPWTARGRAQEALPRTRPRNNIQSRAGKASVMSLISIESRTATSAPATATSTQFVSSEARDLRHASAEGSIPVITASFPQSGTPCPAVVTQRLSAYRAHTSIFQYG